MAYVNFDKESMRYKKDAILLLSVKIAKLFFAGKVSNDFDLVAMLSGNLVQNSIILLLFLGKRQDSAAYLCCFSFFL